MKHHSKKVHTKASQRWEKHGREAPLFKAKILCVSGNKYCSKKAIKKFNDLALAKKQMDCPVNMERLLKDGVVDTA